MRVHGGVLLSAYTLNLILFPYALLCTKFLSFSERSIVPKFATAFHWQCFSLTISVSENNTRQGSHIIKDDLEKNKIK